MGKRFQHDVDMLPESTLPRKAARLARRGEHRKAALAMREAVAHEPTAANYCRLGVMLDRAGRRDEAVDALKQALYLFRRQDQFGRMRTVAGMIQARGGRVR